jgi:serine/threonine protein kinase
MPPYVSSDAKDLISRLLTYDPKKRITIDEVLDHPFLKNRGGS